MAFITFVLFLKILYMTFHSKTILTFYEYLDFLDIMTKISTPLLFFPHAIVRPFITVHMTFKFKGFTRLQDREQPSALALGCRRAGLHPSQLLDLDFD